MGLALGRSFTREVRYELQDANCIVLCGDLRRCQLFHHGACDCRKRLRHRSCLASAPVKNWSTRGCCFGAVLISSYLLPASEAVPEFESFFLLFIHRLVLLVRSYTWHGLESAPPRIGTLLDNWNVRGKLHIEQQVDAPVQLEEQRSLFSGKYVPEPRHPLLA